MIKKILIGLLVVLVLPALCLAAADSSRAASVGGDVESIVGVADGSSGYMLEINSNTGAALVADRATAVGTNRSEALTGTSLIYTGACRIQSISLSSATAADYAEIYDGTSTSGTVKFDPRIASNTSSIYVDAKGAPFATGIYVVGIDGDAFVTVVYDY